MLIITTPSLENKPPPPPPKKNLARKNYFSIKLFLDSAIKGIILPGNKPPIDERLHFPDATLTYNHSKYGTSYNWTVFNLKFSQTPFLKGCTLGMYARVCFKEQNKWISSVPDVRSSLRARDAWNLRIRLRLVLIYDDFSLIRIFLNWYLPFLR